MRPCQGRRETQWYAILLLFITSFIRNPCQSQLRDLYVCDMPEDAYYVEIFMKFHLI